MWCICSVLITVTYIHRTYIHNTFSIDALWHMDIFNGVNTEEKYDEGKGPVMECYTIK